MASKIVILGSTGVGKSTLIQFLAGCDFKFVFHEQLRKQVLTPTDPSKLLNGFKISAEYSSETKEVSSLLLPRHLYNFGLDQAPFLVDTPGFEDTEGAEEDVKNFLLLHKEFAKAAETRFLFLANFEGLESGRGNEIIKLAEQISLIFRNEDFKESVFSSCTIGVTHLKPDMDLNDARSVTMFLFDGKLKALKESKRKLKENEKFQMMILQAIVNNKIKVIMIDEARIKKKDLVSEILSRNGITKGFSFRMTETLLNYINSLASTKLMELSDALTGKEKKFQVATDCLKEIKELSEMSKDKDVEEIYKKSQKLVEDVEESLAANVAGELKSLLLLEFDAKKTSVQLETIPILTKSNDRVKQDVLSFITQLCEALDFSNFTRFLTIYDYFVSKITQSTNDGNSFDPNSAVNLMMDGFLTLSNTFKSECTSLNTEMHRENKRNYAKKAGQWFHQILAHSRNLKKLEGDQLFTKYFSSVVAFSEDENWKNPDKLLEFFSENVLLGIMGCKGALEGLKCYSRVFNHKNEFPKEFSIMESLISIKVESEVKSLMERFEQGEIESDNVTGPFYQFEDACRDVELEECVESIQLAKGRVAEKQEEKRKEAARAMNKLKSDLEEGKRLGTVNAQQIADYERRLKDQERHNAQITAQLNELRNRRPQVIYRKRRGCVMM